MSYQTAQTARKAISFAVLLSLMIAFVPRITLVLGRAKTKKENKVASGPTSTSASQNMSRHFGDLPLSFEPNHGQSHKKAKFLSRGSGYRLFLSATEATIALNSSTESSDMLRMRIIGGNANGKVSGERQLPSKSNYLVGDRRNWKVDLPTYGSVRVENVYRGIDVLYYGIDQRRLEYDFVVAPGAEPKKIRLGFDGAEKVYLVADGSLHLNTKSGEIVQPAPFIYQELEGKRQQIDGRYVLAGPNEVIFEIGQYDRTRTLVIDPRLVYSSFHGGSGVDNADGIAVDLNGNAYIVGTTRSANLNLAAPFQGNLKGSSDIFVAKVNSTGTALIYSTYLGGSSGDFGEAIAVTSDGKVCITGQTDNAGNGSDYPVTDSRYQGNGFGLGDRGSDAVITVLTPAGNGLVYSTFLGGKGADAGLGIAVDGFNKVYVTGSAHSENFPTKNAFNDKNKEKLAGFVAKFDPVEEGNRSLVYSSFIDGEAGTDLGRAIAVTQVGVAFVIGDTTSRDFPTRSSSSLPPLQTNIGGDSDAFVMKVSPTGDLIYSTFFGGDGLDQGAAIAVDANERAYITGVTKSNASTFPLKNAFDGTRSGAADAFVAKLNADGTTLFYSSYITASDVNAQGDGIGIDAGGNAYVTGHVTTRSVPFPEVNGFPAEVVSGSTFIVKVGPSDATGTTIPSVVYSDTLPPSIPRDLAVDTRGNVYIAGRTPVSENVTTPGSFQPTLGGAQDAFVLKISSTVPDTIGTYRSDGKLFLLRNSNTAGNSDINIEFGEAGDLPVSGDWDGNGVTDVGVFRPSTGEFVLRVPLIGNTFSTITIRFGAPGDLPVAGDWNGDGIDTPGVFRPGPVGTFLLTNTITNGSAPSPDLVFSFGITGDLPVVGDWNGDTIDTIGVFRINGAGEFHLSNDFENSTDIFFNFGTKGDLPLAGDWTGKGFDTPGVFRSGKSTMFLANNFVNVADIFFVFGQSGDKPIAGNWDGQ
jgi:hypothetical protein